MNAKPQELGKLANNSRNEIEGHKTNLFFED